MGGQVDKGDGGDEGDEGDRGDREEFLNQQSTINTPRPSAA